MKILYIAMDWFWIKARPQQLAIALSNQHQVDYYCIRGWRGAQQKNYSDQIKVVDQQLFYNDNLRIIRKRYLPGQSKAVVQQLNNWLFIHRELSKLQAQNKYDCIFVTAPPQVTYLPKNIRTNIPIYYDCMDDYSEFFPNPADKQRMLKYETQLVSITKGVFASSDYLKQLLLKRNQIKADKVLVVQNGVETKDFQNMVIKNQVDVIPEAKGYKGIIGYVGTVGSWFDIKSVTDAAEALPDYLFYFAGPQEVEFTDIPENIVFVGPVPYVKVPALMASFDVATMPFIVTDLIKAVNPVKIYEYLAAGTPVVAVDYPETQNFGNMITRYQFDQSGSFTAAIQASLAVDQNKNKDARRTYAIENDWRHRAEQMLSILDKK